MFGRKNIDEIFSLKKLGFEIISQNKIENVNEIYSILLKNESATEQIVQIAKLDLLGVYVMVVRNSENKLHRVNEDTKIKLLKIVSLTLTHNKLDHKELLFFLNLFGSLLQEIYDLETCKFKDTSEEHTWEVLNAVCCLFESATEELCMLLYTKENAMRICKIIFVVGEILKSKSRKLKAEALKCLMAVFRVNPETDIEWFFMNAALSNMIADCFSYFLPGIAMFLASVIMEGERIGHGILQLTVDAVGKIMPILLKDYNSKQNEFEDAKAIILNRLNSVKKPKSQRLNDKKEDYLKMERNSEWFDSSDRHLAPIFANFKYLTQHQSDRVRLKLAEMCRSLIKHCYKNIPQSSYPLIELLVIMSNDENQEISKVCVDMLDLPILEQHVMTILSDRFYHNYSKIPTIFNGIDIREQVNILKLTTASIKIVGNKLKCNDSFIEFQRMLLYLCEVQIDTSTFSEVVSHEDLDSAQPILVDLWKNFKFMREETVRHQFGELCKVIFEAGLFPIQSDYLINIITFGEEKVEAFYLMNQLIHGMNKANQNRDEPLLGLVMPIFQTYIDNWDIPLELDDDECTTLKVLRTNILQAGLLCEGVGLMVLHAKGEDQYRPFLFNCLYKVLVRAASSHYQIQAAAANALKNMASGLSYPSVTHLLNANMDFFLFNIERGLRRTDQNSEVFDVMEMVMRYGDVSILEHFSEFVHEVLVQSFDRFKQNRIDHYLRVFKVFVKSLMRWFEVAVPPRVFKTRLQKRQEELDSFKIGGLDPAEEITNFSDEIMGKSAEEMYKEDLEKKKTELEKEYIEPQEEPYEKPKPPLHIKITVEILKRSLNYLPSKDATRKLTVLEILKNGIEVIKDFEDELLPIVHLIWSPLVDRFKDGGSPVIVNYSFQLLVTLGRVSKDFIRNRTAKDVLPNLLSILSSLSKKSYMKDKGSSYRYSLDYKLQLLMLENFAYLVTDIELLEKDIETIMNRVLLYLSDKQPRPLQVEAVKFFELITKYDPVFMEKIESGLVPPKDEYQKNLNVILNKDKTTV